MNLTFSRILIERGTCLLSFLFFILSLMSCRSIEKQQQTPQQQPLQDEIVCDTIIEPLALVTKPFRSPLIPMVSVEGGTIAVDGVETNTTTVPSFYISKYEVTQAQWKQLMNTNPSEFIGNKLPVDHVSWLEAVEFCNRLSEREGLTPAYRITPERVSCNFQADGYRLPTEAEWEFAARGGNNSQAYVYSGGNDLGQVAWCLDNSGRESHPVGKKQPNELGLHDMSGNVWEWCWEWYDASHSSHTIRGGSWYSLSNYYSDDLLVWKRAYYFEPETWVAVIPVGIRVCRSQ